MDYNILEARIEFNNGAITRITVLVEMSKGDIRAIFATTKPRNGYMHIAPNAIVSNELLQEVAGYGMETVDRDEIFPKWNATQSIEEKNNEALATLKTVKEAIETRFNKKQP